MPWVEDAEELPAADMPPIPTLDNTEMIDALLAEYNQAQGWPPQPGADDTGGATTGGDTDGLGDGGEWTTGGEGTSPAAGDGDGGCGCTTARRHHGLTWAWMGLFGLGLVVARRRRRGNQPAFGIAASAASRSKPAAVSRGR
jgi:MYXO-CTERM domain-containing protein